MSRQVVTLGAHVLDILGKHPRRILALGAHGVVLTMGREGSLMVTTDNRSE